MSEEVISRLIFGKWIGVRTGGRMLEAKGRTGAKLSADRSLMCLGTVRRSGDRRTEIIQTGEVSKGQVTQSRVL